MPDLDPVAALIVAESPTPRGTVLVIDDHGPLARAALDTSADVLAVSDRLDVERALRSACPEARVVDVLTPDLLHDVHTVWWRLPADRGALDELAGIIAAGAPSDVRVVAGGRVKHMSLSMNTVLGRHFASVRASRGVRHSRVLHANEPTPGRRDWPRRASADVPGGSLTVVAHGATFAGTRVDAGTRLLLDRADLSPAELTSPEPTSPDATRPDPSRPPGDALDLGCGSGIIACVLARAGWTTHASDISTAAVLATRATAEANGFDLTVHRASGLEGWPARSLDLIVTNPPFHVGTAKDSSATLRMFDQVRSVLRPGGSLWTVWNAHLPYLAHLRRQVGQTRVAARDRHYVLTHTRV